MYLKGRNGYFFKSFCQILNYRNLKMCDVRLNDNIKRTSGINLEGPSLIRRSRKVWDPPKKWSNCANGENPNFTHLTNEHFFGHPVCKNTNLSYLFKKKL